MKTLIVFCSSHGTTEKAVRLLTERIQGEALAVDLKKERQNFHLKNFDTVIIGGSIHAGSIQGRIRKFIKEYHDELLEKELGLFLCCIYDGDKAVDQFNQNFPQELRKNSIAMGLFSGEFLLSKMNFIEKQMVKHAGGMTNEQHHMDIEAINEFADRVNLAMKMLVY